MRSVCLILGLIHVVCCGQPERDCPQIRDEIVQSLGRYHQSINDSTYLIEALRLSETGIQCDPNNISFYDLKFNALFLLNRNRESLNILDKIWKLSDHRDIKMKASKGIVYEKMGKMDSAKATYDSSLLACNQKLSGHPRDSIQIICDKLYVIALCCGKESALEEFDKYYSTSGDATLSAFRDYLRDFDKKRILFSQ